MKGKPRTKPATPQEPAKDAEGLLPQPKPATPGTASSSLVPKRILVPTDFSECSLRALEYGAELAMALGARLILLHVAEPAVYAENFLAVSPASEDVNQSLLKKSMERLVAIGRDQIAHCAPEQILVRLGHAHSEITDSAEALGADLIVLGTHGNPLLKHGVLGSTAERVVRQASCPVITVREKSAIVSERR